MAITTYAELQTALGEWANRSDLASMAPDFIALAEAWMRPQLQLMWLEKAAYAETVAGQETLTMPDDYNGMRMLHIEADPRIPLEQVSLPYLRSGTETSTPKYFAVADSAIMLGPIPDAVYQVRMTYYAFPVLSDANTTNEILTRYPGIYLFGALAEYADWMRDDAARVKHEMKRDVAMQEAIRHDSRLRYSTPMQTRVKG